MQYDIIHNQDCLVGMKQIPNACIDCIVTDPPYRVTSRGSSGTMTGYWATDITRQGRIFEYNDIDIADYLPDFYRVLKDNSHCYIMCNNLNLPRFFEVISKSQFHFIKLLVWDKQNKICGKYYMGQVEHIFFLRKGADKPINDCGASDLLSFANRRDKQRDGSNIHDSQKPVALFQTLIRNSTESGGVILDPFCGSGTAAIAAIKEHRHYICYEIDNKYYDIATKRIKHQQSVLTLF
jgi:site-specific DNA-methyltransferase (adenine-specific)